MHPTPPRTPLHPRPRHWIKVAGASAVLALLAACGGSDAPPSQQLTLEQKVGQMVMMGVDGTSADAPGVQQALAQVRAGQLGGVILYRYNITDPTQVRALTGALQQANPLELPLLIALDQEGGLVQRLRASNGFADTPSHEEVAATQTPDQARATYRTMAQMVAGAGFNFNFGPVVDLRGDPLDPEHRAVSPVIGQLKRSFSDDPARVVLYASQFILAHREAGVLTALKHYPGHGLAASDSHLGLVDITRTAQPIEQWPFQQLVAGGMADAIMTAHLVNRNVDPDWPVTLSEKFIGPQLRTRDGFDGVVVTDDLHMGAIQQHHSLRESVVRAIVAGNDVLVFSNNPGAAKNAPGFVPRYDMGQHAATLVREAIARGELTTEQVDAAWQRLARLRGKLAAAH
ncbi:MAG: glycoside hydrolase family 3 N-terminal domain-containing protein [Simplicispira sp.]|uniref:glycoside hydrolase family 3 N-terminal domain-containing protein n=1 Tax=Simplicispira sp. TaxID=2015802 RepID=UPI00258433C4|nr:glycoside hydrolase family 3 N-terminal domain-containing protein [Simplicispira sp.]MDD2690918.1 glycoside hydrolase family 3 N-terminal domain-containing protein [Simplicispira sp.]